MVELLVLTVGIAVAGFVVFFLLAKALVWLISIPIHLGVWLVKGLLGLVIGIPIAIIGFVVCSVLLPVVGVVIPIVLAVLAIPLMLIGCFVLFLKLIF